MNKKSLGCGKRYKDFICGVANAWGVERLCEMCNYSMRREWNKEDLRDRKEVKRCLNK